MIVIPAQKQEKVTLSYTEFEASLGYTPTPVTGVSCGTSPSPTILPFQLPLFL